VSPVRYELGFYIPGCVILHSRRHGNLKSLWSLLTRVHENFCSVSDPYNFNLLCVSSNFDIHNLAPSFILIHNSKLQHSSCVLIRCNFA
jgi:hypothetical protein